MMKTPTKDQVIVYIYIAGGLLGAYFIYKVMAKLGLIKTASDRKEEQAVAELREYDYFNPMVLKDHSWARLGETQAKNFALELYRAMHGSVIFGLGTDEEAIYSVFGKMTDKYQIAEVSGWYQIQFDKSLLSDILNELNDSEKATLMNIINNIA